MVHEILEIPVCFRLNLETPFKFLVNIFGCFQIISKCLYFAIG